MDCFGTYLTHVQSCDVTRVQNKCYNVSRNTYRPTYKPNPKPSYNQLYLDITSFN